MFDSTVVWKDPTTWPWFVYVWAAFLSIGSAKPVWRWFRVKRASGWPTSDGRINSAQFNKPNFSFLVKRGHFVAEVFYSYFAEGNSFSGRYIREIPTEYEAEDFVRDLENKPLTVRYNPTNPSRSVVLESDIDLVLQRRSPVLLPVGSRRVAALPQWTAPYLRILLTMSCVGLILSLWIHFGAVMGQRVAPEAFFWILHMGIFVVWFPAVFLAQKLVGNVNRRDFWKVLLKHCPTLLRYMVYGFLGYAMLNFLFVMRVAPAEGGGPNPPAQVWRGFSGHWMAFYSAAIAIFYSSIRSQASTEHR